MKVKVKKIIAVLMLLLVIINALPMNAFAAFITDINSNAEFGVIDGTLAEFNHEMHYAKYDGATYLLFCTEYGQKSPTGQSYQYGNDFLAEFKANRPEFEKIAEMIYFGYAMDYGMGLPGSYESKVAAACTQQYVWEQLGNAPSRDSWNANYMSSGKFAEWSSRTEGYYNQYHGNTSFNGTTNKATIGQSMTITDSNGKLSSYPTFSQNLNGVIFGHTQGSNDLIVTVAEDCAADTVTFNTRDYGLYQLMPNGASYNSGTMSNYVHFKFTSGSVQNLMFSNYIDPSTFSVSVEVEYGNALVIKTNANGDTLAGCTFELYKDEKCTQKVRTGTSDASGNIHFKRLAPGSYYVKEVNVPKGYLLDTSIQKVEVRVNETTEISFKNYEPTGEIKLIKTDRETGRENRADGTSHHGDATLEGTEYTLYASEDIYNVAKTVKYFSKDEQIATYNFNSNGIATVHITTKSTSANLTTDGNVLKGLPMGTYYAKETKVPDGYLQDNEVHTYTLKYKDMNTPVIKLDDTLTNQVEKAKFEVIKMSSITNDTAPIVDGAEFTAILTKYVDYYGSFDEALKHLDEFSKDEYSVFTTENNGHGISGLLAYGKYTVNETYCPDNKINPVKEFTVTIDKNSDGVIKELIENDTPFTSYIKMIKKDLKTGKVVTFSNATFSLYKLNEENGAWEKVSCKLGKESFDTWTTDENGIAYTETKLNAGTYKVEEIKVPNGFLQLDEELTFEINRDNETLEYDKDMDAYITVEIKNEQPTGTLIVDKSVALRENVDTSLVDISDLSGIEFKLTAKEDIIDYADGSIIYKKGQEVKVFNLDKDGNYTIKELPMGTYELQETKTLDGLVLNTKKYEIKFEQKDLTTKVYEEKKDIVNDTTIFEFSKTDITGDKELEGATLTVFDKDNNVVDTWVSGEKPHSIEGLKVGEKYTLKEEIAPDDFVKATNIEFLVEDKDSVQKVVMVDKLVTLKKSDIGGNEVEGAEIKIIDKETNEVVDEWTSSKEEHKIKGLEEGKTYILHEEVAPDGYVLAQDTEFTVTLEKETQKLNLINKRAAVKKTDFVTGEEIEGAELYVLDEENNIVDEWTSTKEEHYVVGLEEGKHYTLVEKTAPYGYEITDSIDFVVSTDKETQLVEMKDMPILKDLRLTKINSKTKEVIKDKFTFGIYEDPDCTKLIKEVESDVENGVANFEDLRYGTYYIKEIKAPNGYIKSDKVVKVDINDKGVFVDDKQIEENENIYNFEFENAPIETPNTGDESHLKLIGGIMILSLLGISLLAIKLYKKHKDEK